MAFPSRGFIQWENFLTYTAQLRSFGTDTYGQPTQTAVTTVPIIVFTERDEVLNTVPLATASAQHFACIPSSYSVAVDDHIQNCTNPLGTVVLADARIQEVADFNHWRAGARIKLLRLEIPVV